MTFFILMYLPYKIRFYLYTISNCMATFSCDGTDWPILLQLLLFELGMPFDVILMSQALLCNAVNAQIKLWLWVDCLILPSHFRDVM